MEVSPLPYNYLSRILELQSTKTTHNIEDYIPVASQENKKVSGKKYTNLHLIKHKK